MIKLVKLQINLQTSNIPFLSKMLEKVVYKQLYNYLSLHILYDVHQSGTETALIKLILTVQLIYDATWFHHTEAQSILPFVC